MMKLIKYVNLFELNELGGIELHGYRINWFNKSNEYCNSECCFIWLSLAMISFALLVHALAIRFHPFNGLACAITFKY